MKISAIISEFNPLHNGHKRLIDFAKANSQAVVCVLSGNFVQRGMPAVANKWQRAKYAILAGADLVVELPTIFATASAKDFAFGGIKTALMSGANNVVFGSVSGDVERLKSCAEAMINSNEKIREKVRLGNVSYPMAVSLALPQFQDLLSQGNDTLAIEYILAGKSLDANLTFETLKRDYDDKNFCTASNLREWAKEGKITKEFLPSFEQSFDVEVESKYKNFAKIFLATQTKEEIEKTLGVVEGLENVLVKAWQSKDFDDFMSKCKSKRYTQAKLQRIVLANVLGITKTDMQQAKVLDMPLKILAVKKDKAELMLSLVKEQAGADLFSKIDDRANKVYFALAGGEKPTKLQKV